MPWLILKSIIFYPDDSLRDDDKISYKQDPRQFGATKGKLDFYSYFPRLNLVSEKALE